MSENQIRLRLHSFSPKRWVICSLCTLCLLCAVLALPFWNFHVKAEVSESFSENAVSVVTVTQKRRAKSAEKPIEKKIQPKTEDAIPAIPKETEKIEETQETEESEEAEETEIESADDENLSDDANDSAESENAGDYAESQTVSEEVQKATASYKSYALGRIASKKQYPYSARSKGVEGKVRLRVVIGTDGKLLSAEILEACESEILNEAALSAVKKSAPFKKMPHGMGDLSLTFVMDFSLK